MATPCSDPCGDLSKLPRELRDEIYRNLLVEIYDVIEPLELNTFGRFEDVIGFPILRASQQISREATEILYNESTFRYQVDIFHEGEYPKIPSKEATSRMMNVNLLIFGITMTKLIPGVDCELTPTIDKNASVVRDIIRTFSGSKVLRKTFLLQFPQCRLFENLINKSCQIIHVLKTLKGFETVKVEFSYRRRDPEKSSVPLSDFAWMQTREQGQAIYIQGVKELTRRELETTLGPDRSKGNLVSDDIAFPDAKMIKPYLEFQPRQHLALLENRSNNSDEDEALMALGMRISLMSLQVRHAI